MMKHYLLEILSLFDPQKFIPIPYVYKGLGASVDNATFINSKRSGAGGSVRGIVRKRYTKKRG
jgi:hypothetical protein